MPYALLSIEKKFVLCSVEYPEEVCRCVLCSVEYPEEVGVSFAVFEYPEDVGVSYAVLSIQKKYVLCSVEFQREVCPMQC